MRRHDARPRRVPGSNGQSPLRPDPHHGRRNLALQNLSRVLAVGIAALSASAFATTTAHAADPTRYVATTGNDTGNTTCDKNHPCKTVQHGVDVATTGDTIRIAAGT